MCVYMHANKQPQTYKAEPSEITTQSGKGATKLTKTAGAANNFLKQIFIIHTQLQRERNRNRGGGHIQTYRVHT
jgi:hypothetical protein